MDVERTLGPPDEHIQEERLTYKFHDTRVDFWFTANPNCKQQLPYTSWNVTPDTVTGIDVILRPSPRIEETGIDLTRYKKIKGDYDLVDHYYYLNADESFVIEVGNNYLAGYHYRPGTKQKLLRCEPGKQQQ